MKKAYLAVVFVVVLGFLLAGVASAGEVVFETTMPWYYWWSDMNWGTTSFTLVTKVAISYRPLANQEVCTIKLGLYKSGNPADEVVMTVKNGVGATVATATVAGDQVSGPIFLPPNIPAYTAFTFPNCLNLNAGVNYFFYLTRTQPGSAGGYSSQMSNLIGYSQTGFWGWVPINGFFQEKFGYEPALRLEGPDNKEPVIIVPGILGSKLNKVSDNQEVWLNTEKMFSPLTRSDNYLDDLKLDNDGNEVLDMNSPEIIENVLFFNQYGELIQKFKDAGYQLDKDLFVVPYDWRLDIEKSSLDLDSVVSQAVSNSPTGKVNIIAHSMGGLLVKDYLMRKGDAGVNRLVFAGTPHLGAPKAFNLLNWGDDFDIKLIGLGLNKNKAKDIAQNMPSAYQLLPSRDYFTKAGSYVKDDNGLNLNYDETSQLMASSQLLEDHRNSGLLTRADEFHLSHGSWLPQSANVYNLLGCREYDTIGSFSLDSDGSVDINSVTGDGTVPLASAEHIPGENYFVSYPMTKINHMGLVSDDRTIDLMYSLVASNSEPVLNSEPTLPPGISKSSANCDNIVIEIKRLRFSTHSPVNLHVYDSLGNHTGLTPEGNIETNIPDSEFTQVGDSSFIFVPDGVQYSVKIDAYATGSFDFKVKELSNGEVQSSVSYEDIPIQNPSLNADFEFTYIDSPSPLNVDENGDGEVDIGYNTDGSKVLYHDEDLPVVMLTSPVAGEFERSATISVNFSVTDNSGVFYATASFDNLIWASSSIDLFFYPLGSHSFVVIAQDPAGNIASKQVDLTSIATIESTVSDINRAYNLGWIPTERERDSYLRKMERIIKIEKRIKIVTETLPDGSKKEKRIERLEKRIDRVLAIAFLNDLEKSYNKGQISEQAHSLIKEDINWLLNH